MANIVITVTGNQVAVDFGDYATALNMTKGTWNKGTVEHIILSSSSVDVYTQDSVKWSCSFNGAGSTLQIDTVDGVAPISNLDLYNKLVTALI